MSDIELTGAGIANPGNLLEDNEEAQFQAYLDSNTANDANVTVKWVIHREFGDAVIAERSQVVSGYDVETLAKSKTRSEFIDAAEDDGYNLDPLQEEYDVKAVLVGGDSGIAGQYNYVSWDEQWADAGNVGVGEPTVEVKNKDGSGGLNSAFIEFDLENPSSVSADVSLEYSVYHGGDVIGSDTETELVSSGVTNHVSATIELNNFLSPGDNDEEVSVCVDVTNVEPW